MDVYAAIPKDWDEFRFWNAINAASVQRTGQHLFYESADWAADANVASGASRDKFYIVRISVERLP